MSSYLFSSESVSEGHPDKVADAISDAILDAYLTVDRTARVAVETLVKDDTVVLAGEISSTALVEAEHVVRETLRTIGYTQAAEKFNADGVKIINLLGRQSPAIARGVGYGLDQGAGDQGIMFGFASNETPERLPLAIALAHRITRTLAAKRHAGLSWLRPDAKAQVTVRYAGNRPVEITDVVVSTQHVRGHDQEELRSWVRGHLLPEALGHWWHAGVHTHINPTGVFDIGGPEGDAGVTGRKIIVDTYGGFARHGGGAFSGKDPSKVDRSAAYFTRWIARQIVDRGIASVAGLQVAYAIGEAAPVSILVDTRGTGDARAAEDFVRGFDFRPGAIIERLDLLRPFYSRTTNYGHFGKADLPWEITDSQTGSTRSPA